MRAEVGELSPGRYDGAMSGQRPKTNRRIARLALAGLLALALPLGCSGQANEICNRIYDDCGGALVDDQGASISREACVRLFEERAQEDAAKVQAIADCVAQTDCSEALTTCFGN